MFRVLMLLAKIGLSAGLVWYVLNRVDVGSALEYLGNIQIVAILVVLALLFVQIVIAGLRLRELLTLMGARCGIIKAIDVAFIGAFFGQTLISFVGGDAMRIWRIVRSNISLGLAARGVLLDRAAGFVGMIILIILGLPFSLQIVRHPEMRWGLLVAIIVAVTGFMAFLSLWRIPDVLKQWRPLRWLADLSLIAVTISRNKKGLFALIGFSLAIHILNATVLYVIALGLSIDITFRDTMILLPPVLLISMLPISVAGWGVREGAMVVALGFVGVPSHHSLALSICFGLCLLVISLPGGVLWFVNRGELASDKVSPADLASKKGMNLSILVPYSNLPLIQAAEAGFAPGTAGPIRRCRSGCRTLL